MKIRIMKKQVTFVDGNKGEHLIQESGNLATRSAGYYCTQRGKHVAVDGLYSNENCGMRTQRTDCFRSGKKATPESQRMTTIHIPKSMMAAPFLQHPSLTTGQKQYLCSIANVYSTSHMRTLMKRHYLNVLQRCIKGGQNPFGGNKTSHSKPNQLDLSYRGEPKAAVWATLNGDKCKTPEQSRKITLPRIGQNRTVLGVSQLNQRRAKTLKLHSYTGGNTSLKGTEQWKHSTMKQEGGEDELLRNDMSSLSIERDEDVPRKT